MTPETRVLEIRYLGNTKNQPGFDERVAFAHDGSGWSAAFPESVLTGFFSGVTADPTQSTTLYGVLGISRGSTQEDIRVAFKALAKQWHADVNRLYDDTAKNAAFIRIKEAYDILSNPNTRGRYNAGLALEASARRGQKRASMPPKQDLSQGYRPNKRCGYVLAEGIQSNGKFVVSKILDWQDITNQDGKTLVTVWTMGEKTYQERWIQEARPPRR